MAPGPGGRRTNDGSQRHVLEYPLILVGSAVTSDVLSVRGGVNGCGFGCSSTIDP